MRADPFVLRFTAPAAALVVRGRHHPCLHGCVLEVGEFGLVRVEGPGRDRVLEQAERYLLHVCPREILPVVVVAVLATPCLCGGRGGRDTWSIIVGAAAAAAPTGIDPHLLPTEASPPLVPADDVSEQVG
jgi:hypothetical protein